jgi:hypothetical protein
MLRRGSTGSITSISKSEPTIRSATLEVRWISRGGVPPGLLDYFGPFREPAEVREDRYLVDPWLPLLGVKIRGGASLDIKVSHGGAKELHLANAATGRLEHWTKWTFPINFTSVSSPGSEPRPDDPAWVAVHKVRRRRSFMVADNLVVERALRGASSPGCSFEISDVTLGEESWWTLAFEAVGSAPIVDRDLRSTAAHALSDPLPDGLSLDRSRSMSYVRWLRSRRPSILRSRRKSVTRLGDAWGRGRADEVAVMTSARRRH